MLVCSLCFPLASYSETEWFFVMCEIDLNWQEISKAEVDVPVVYYCIFLLLLDYPVCCWFAYLNLLTKENSCAFNDDPRKKETIVISVRTTLFCDKVTPTAHKKNRNSNFWLLIFYFIFLSLTIAATKEVWQFKIPQTLYCFWQPLLTSILSRSFTQTLIDKMFMKLKECSDSSDLQSQFLINWISELLTSIARVNSGEYVWDFRTK